MPNPTTPTANDGDDFYELLMLYGHVCSEESLLGQKAVEMRMGIASMFIDREREAERRGAISKLRGLRDWAINMYPLNSQGYMTVVEIDDQLHKLTHPKKEDI